MKKADDPYIALLNYRATPLLNKFSPSELLMGRKLQTKLPIMEQKLQPQSPNPELLHERESRYRENMCRQYNNRHLARKPQANINPGDNVFVKDMGRNAKVIKQHHSPRSYIIQPENSDAPTRRNRKALIPDAPQDEQNTQVAGPIQNNEQSAPAPVVPCETPPPSITQTSTPRATRISSFGRTVKPPQRLDL